VLFGSTIMSKGRKSPSICGVSEDQGAANQVLIGFKPRRRIIYGSISEKAMGRCDAA
jgi:hypothetical protein